MTESQQNLANDIVNTTRELNAQLEQAALGGLHVVAKVNESLNLDNPRSGKRVHIEVALLLPITPRAQS